MSHPKNRAERRSHKERVIKRRIFDILYRNGGEDHYDVLYGYQIGSFAKKHPFTCSRRGCICKLRYPKIDREPRIDDYEF